MIKKALTIILALTLSVSLCVPVFGAADITEPASDPGTEEISEQPEEPAEQPEEPAEEITPLTEEEEAAHYPISKVTVEGSEFTYTGEELNPAVIVYTENGEVLAPENYTAGYTDNVNVGTAAVHIDGKGEYEGETAEAAFEIIRAAITDATLKYSSLIYTGNKRTQTGTTVVFCGDKVLTKGKDYKISYTNNVNVGTATMTIEGKGNYTGSYTAEFTIKPAGIKKAEVTLSKSAYKYNGKKRKPPVTVVQNGTKLKKNRDYTVSYKNNKNTGTATVKVKGKGNYRGTRTKTFKITSVKISKAALSYTSVCYNGKARKPKVTVTAIVNGKKRTLKNGADYKVTYKDNVNVGTATVTIRGKGNYSGTIKKTFRIKPVPLSELTAGDIVDRKMIKGIESKYFKSYVINCGDSIYNYINGKSYYDNPNVALSDLRYLKVLHYNFDHKIQVGEIIVNKSIAKNVIDIFKQLFDAEYEIYSMYLIDRFWTGDPETSDDESCNYNNTSGFCYRAATNSSVLSRHAYGMAVDINPRQNPYVWWENGKWTCFHPNARKYIDRSKDDPHMIKTGDICYDLFTQKGFSWGGERIDPIDYQHFER